LFSREFVVQRFSRSGRAAIGCLAVFLFGGQASGQDQSDLESLRASAQPLNAEQTKFFEAKIRPVLIRECYACHSKQSGQAKGGLRLDTREGLLLGGDSGPALVSGDPEASLFFGAITHTDFVMPPNGKLSDDEIADFRSWIEAGAPDPRVTTPIDAPEQTIDQKTIAEAKRSFWAYQPPRKIEPMSTSELTGKLAEWPQTTIDQYLVAKLQEAGLAPAPDASATIVLRRLCFDLVGLPPTPDEIRWFEKAYASDPNAAIEHVVDQLLDKPQFGERWARHWLDVVRYAESTGREVNMTYPHAWRYRDYVIDAFNDDKPFNEFVQEQLAGDLLPAKSDEEWTEHLIATGFLAFGTKNVNEQSRAQFAADLADEQIDTTTRVFLGTSVACARCHDHKFDPIRQSDYYAMAGIFRSTETFFGNPPNEYGNVNTPQMRQTSSLLLLPVADPNAPGESYSTAELEQLNQELQSKLEELSSLRRVGLSESERAAAQRTRLRLTAEISRLSAKLSVVDKNGEPRSYCMGVQDRDVVDDAPLLVRGEIDQPAGRVRRGLPAVLSDQPFEPKAGTSGRLELARWIGSDRNTLAARVAVNRIWAHVFGQGIVPTTEDFGMTGTYPSHPELLDHLAIEFADGGWSTKTMIRRMVTSRAYRMQSRFDAASHEQDPDNRLMWRSHRRRLDAESIRDAMLAVAGQLETARPTGSVVADAGYMRVRDGRLEDPREAIRRQIQMTLTSRRERTQAIRERLRRGNARGRMAASGQLRRQMDGRELGQLAAKAYSDASLDSNDSNHRSVYLPIVRDFVPRSLEVFDFPDPTLISGVRETSNTPNQALFMLNNPLTLRLSDAFAQRLIDEVDSPGGYVEHAFQLAYGRPPNSQERVACYRYLRDSARSPKAALASFCQSLFAAAEFRYLD
jgi:hypothetical protein